MKVTNAEYRARARHALQDQWGINAGIYFVYLVISTMVTWLVSQVLKLESGTMKANMMSTILEIVVLFALTYGTYYVALTVIRGGRATTSGLFAIFQSQYYVPMLILNLIATVISFLLNLIVYIPMLISYGSSFYWFVVTANGSAAQVTSLDTFDKYGIGAAGIVILVLITLALLFFMNSILSGIFQIAAWAKMDFPELPIMQAFKYGWRLLKDNWGQYILLNLSFIGWGILAIFTCGVGLLWLVPYINVATAAFYDGLRIQKGNPDTLLA